MKVKIYCIPASHPCRAVFKAAELKGIDYKRVVLPPPAQAIVAPLLFGGRTVPDVKISDGPTGDEKVQGTRKIMRTFESIQPEPPLFPADPAERVRVEEVEAWGDGPVQELARRLIWVCLQRDPKAMAAFGAGEINLPVWMQNLGAPTVAWIERKINSADDASTQADLQELPAMLDRIDRYIADGVIGGESPNAGDLQIFASLWLMRSVPELRDAIDARRSGEITQRLFGDPPGVTSAGLLPEEWLAPLRTPAGAAA